MSAPPSKQLPEDARQRRITRLMAARIDSAEVVSFRLKVPRIELERLPNGAVGQEIALELTHDEGELVLAPKHGDSFARFRPIGPEAVLTEIFVAGDTNGDFFLRVLGPLVVRFAGDLELRIIWNVPERNQNGDHALVRITRGMTDYPGLGHVPMTEAEAQASGAGPSRGAGGSAAGNLRNTLRAGGEELGGSDVDTPEEKEVRELLEKAKAQYEKYLKARGRK